MTCHVESAVECRGGAVCRTRHWGGIVEDGGIGDGGVGNEGAVEDGSVESGGDIAGGSVGGGDIRAGVVGMRHHAVAVI